MKFTPATMIAEGEVLGWKRQFEINPFTGNRRLQICANDVMSVVEIMGGVQVAARNLGVEEIEVEHWIDDHYVPTRYAERIKELTGWSVWSIQAPPFDVEASVGATWEYLPVPERRM